jgi:hypothetical protein
MEDKGMIKIIKRHLYENIDHSDNPYVDKLLQMIHFVKSSECPPCDAENYYRSHPWNLFGSLDQYMKWVWYYDSVILSRANYEDISLAYELCIREGRDG